MVELRAWRLELRAPSAAQMELREHREWSQHVSGRIVILVLGAKLGAARLEKAVRLVCGRFNRARFAMPRALLGIFDS